MDSTSPFCLLFFVESLFSPKENDLAVGWVNGNRFCQCLFVSLICCPHLLETNAYTLGLYCTKCAHDKAFPSMPASQVSRRQIMTPGGVYPIRTVYFFKKNTNAVTFELCSDCQGFPYKETSFLLQFHPEIVGKISVFGVSKKWTNLGGWGWGSIWTMPERKHSFFQGLNQ